MPRLILGHNRCEVKKIFNPFYSGLSQGQGNILRRDVWESIGRGFLSRGAHVQYLRNFREFVMWRLGAAEYHSNTCRRKFFFWNETKEHIVYELRDAAQTRIRFFDVALENSTSAVFVQTPFSSHFPWDGWREIPVCDDEQKEIVQRDYPKDVKYLLELAGTLIFGIKDACNNKFFANAHSEC